MDWEEPNETWPALNHYVQSSIWLDGYNIIKLVMIFLLQKGAIWDQILAYVVTILDTKIDAKQ